MRPKKLNHTIFPWLFLVLLVQQSWAQNIAPVLTATGNQPYCPQSQINIVTDFSITDPDDTEIEALYIQISTGYEQGLDRLILLGSHPNITTSWSAVEGKLTLHGLNSNPVGYVDLIAAVKDIVFQSSSVQPNNKVFSITIGDANYLPLTGHYYEFVPSNGISWHDAKQEAENRTYFGLQGYLATILYPEEDQLAGEQASGAGWLGGTDEGNEGVWKWVTGPESGTVFWNGGNTGSSPNYANWNINQPDNAWGGEGEDYLHITDPSIGRLGAWNDLRVAGDGPGPYHPKGYIVEYGGTEGDPVLNISTSTNIYALTVVSPLSPNLTFSECDNLNDGDDSNGFTNFDLTATETDLLNGNSPTDFYFEYFTDASYTNIISNPENFINTMPRGQAVYVRIINNANASCYTETSFDIVVSELPFAEPSIDFKNCDDDGVADGFTEFNLDEVTPFVTSESGVSISYHSTFAEAEKGDNQITIPVSNQMVNPVYARVENADGCYQISTINLKVSTTSFPSGYFEELKTCDEDGVLDGFHEFDLTQKSASILGQFPADQNLSIHYYETALDAHLEENEILQPSSYINSVAFYQEIYARIESLDNGDCVGIAPALRLTVYDEPKFEVDNSYVYCQEGPPITLYTFNSAGNYSYQWFDDNGQIISNSSFVEVASGGDYSVVATSSFGCASNPISFSVKESGLAKISLDDITIVDASKNNSISVETAATNLGLGTYQFALNDADGPYQESPFFDGLNPGSHTLYIRDENGCGIASIEVFILGFPKFFTPNNDGRNDFWSLEGLGADYLSTSKVSIFNRYGKLIKEFEAQDVWDGTFKGQNLPNSDYWFVAELEKTSGEIKIYRGHFSLKR